MKSLFNEQIPDVPPKPIRGKYVSWKQENRYRKTKGGQKCGNCIHFVRTGYRIKTYFKCNLMGSSLSSATDIRAGYVCDRWIRGEAANDQSKV